ncbi:hypothetical protein J2Y55_004304 [Bosea sp. BE125]|uniref:DUF4123 domain-containing protein n=1 Tax=Bosea sp. BE125 TaxID=2817909 RepID=UPI00285E41DA|nr:DUF4123 domain-containing protein [Bosea sp. BE125]MDR6873280.1 hypothetical protein [Bosea sp. BE125]
MSIDWDFVPLAPASLQLNGAALKAAVASLPNEIFAVLDGALFDDLASDLQLHGLKARPMFLEAGKPQAVSVGPFLVALQEPDDTGRLLACHGARRLPVFWSWSEGEAALFRHLRTLNLAEIPNQNRASEDAPAYETVIFRHWDAVVLGQVLPLLRPGQIARFLGPGLGLCFDAGVAGGVSKRLRPQTLPAADTGMLRFSPEQVAGLSHARVTESRGRICNYLREVSPDKAANLPPAALLNLVAHSERLGRDMGLRTERALGLWAFLWLLTDGKVADSYEIKHLLTTSGMPPEEALNAFLQAFMVTAGSP